MRKKNNSIQSNVQETANDARKILKRSQNDSSSRHALPSRDLLQNKKTVLFYCPYRHAVLEYLLEVPQHRASTEKCTVYL